MREKTVMRQALASMVAEKGEDAQLEEFCARVADGENPVDLARAWGVSWYVMREWLESNDGMKRLELAKRCYADGLIWEGLQSARMANPDNVQVSRLQAEHFTKIAEKMSRREWGAERAVVVNTGVTIDQALGVAALALLDRMKVVDTQVPSLVESDE